VHEQTASTIPEIDAIPYETDFFASGLKYFRIASFLTKAAMAPAIKNAGTRQVMVCAARYSMKFSLYLPH